MLVSKIDIRLTVQLKRPIKIRQTQHLCIRILKSNISYVLQEIPTEEDTFNKRIL